MKKVALKSPAQFVTEAARLLKKDLKSTIIVGKDHKDVGVSMEIIKTDDHDNVFLDGWSLDAFGGKSRVGLGVSKDIISRRFVEIDAGIFATSSLVSLLSGKINPKMSIGISGKVRF